jgi:YD repeat-containing protein
MIPVKQANLAVLALSILAVPLSIAQVRPTEEHSATLSDREQHGLRGPVKSCTEESTYPGGTDAEGKTYPEVHSEHTTQYDTDGRLLLTRFGNSDGSQWMTRYSYDASGRLLKTATGVEGTALTETTYSYDQEGRLQNISDSSKPDSPVAYQYDEKGRKSKIEILRSEDYSSTAKATSIDVSPFDSTEALTHPPSGGSATTIYDEHDRATEIQVRDASGELVNRAIRTYDAQGRVKEEKQIWDSPEAMFPLETHAKMLEESGLSADQLRQELRTGLTKLMGGQPGLFAVSYRYDTHGRINHTNRRIFNEGQEIETAYNEHGDLASEITRSTGLTGETDPAAAGPGLPSYSEVRYSYQYDQHDNWIERSISSRSAPDAAFESSTAMKRTVTYY